ncbi:MAG: hypothetical protein O3A20_09870 [Planctomycetota bacterium]|nr:hypothetical protein [Planctomycetota bacterium]
MRTPRWRLLLPIALLVTLLAPAIRLLPGGAWYPDVWLLLALGAVPVPAPYSWRRAGGFILLLGLLRATVSSVSLVSSCAGLVAAVCVRELLHRRLSEHFVPLRLVVGSAAAAIPTLLDARAASLAEAALPPAVLAVRALAVGAFWMLLSAPASWNREASS